MHTQQASVFLQVSFTGTIMQRSLRHPSALRRVLVSVGVAVQHFVNLLLYLRQDIALDKEATFSKVFKNKRSSTVDLLLAKGVVLEVQDELMDGGVTAAQVRGAKLDET